MTPTQAQIDELVKAATEVTKWIDATDDVFLAEHSDRLIAALKPFEQEEGR